jgi:hypothetical protein
LTKKSHNYKKKPVELEDSAHHAEEDGDDEEEGPVKGDYLSGPKPTKQKLEKSESEDADYGAYKLAESNPDVEDYEDSPKFAHYKSPLTKSEKLTNANTGEKNYEILPSGQFNSKNLNQALADFKTKDWSKCNMLRKGEMTCYYCKDAKGATQEECMFISSTNPKNIKLDFKESKSYDINSRSPTKAPAQPVPAANEVKEKFARLRMGRPLMPTKASLTAEPLMTPKSLNVGRRLGDNAEKKTIKRQSISPKWSDDSFYPEETQESRAIEFESRVRHF